MVDYSAAPFSWDDPTDAGELYHLGTSSDGTEPKLFFPYGKDGQVYTSALLDAIKSGSPAVAQFAQGLLDNIEAEKKQSLKNTDERGATWGRAMPRRPGHEENFYRRCDGYLIPPK